MAAAGRAKSARAALTRVLLVGACSAASLLACAGEPAPVIEPYVHEAEAIGTAREMYDGALAPEVAIRTFRNTHRLFPTRVVTAAATPRPLHRAEQALAIDTLRLETGPVPFDSLLARNRVAALLVLRADTVLMEIYRYGNTPETRWMSMSVAKSVLATMFGAALHDGSLRSLDTGVTELVPALRGSAYDGVSIRQALQMRSGVRWNEAYTDSTSDRRRLLEAHLELRPGAMLEVMAGLPRAAEPGTQTTYSTGETQVLAAALRAAVREPLADYLAVRIWQPAGAEADAQWWLDAPDGVEIGGSGLSARLRDYGRFGLFVLDEGVVDGDTLLPPGWSLDAGSQHSTTPEGWAYGMLWWPSSRALGERHQAFTAEGIHGQFVHVDPTARVVIVQWSARPEPSGGEAYDDYQVLEALVDAVQRRDPP